jgi:hypothetical protein
MTAGEHPRKRQTFSNFQFSIFQHSTRTNMATAIHGNIKHWKVVIDGRIYLSHQSSADAAIFAALRRAPLRCGSFEDLHHEIEATRITRPRDVPFAEFQRQIEG